MKSRMAEGISSIGAAERRRAEALRLMGLAQDMLISDQEQIVRDYLGHALQALAQLRDSSAAELR